MTRSYVAGVGIALLITACSVGENVAPRPSGRRASHPDAISGATKRYRPFTFENHDPHARALGGECTLCHHPVDGRPTVAKSCRTCHDAPDAAIRLPTAMHTSCRGCHVERARLEQPSGPVACLDCHRERN